MPLLLLMLGWRVALAHPFGGTLPGHELHLTLREDAVELRYSARVPTHDVMQELKEAGEPSPDAFSEKKLVELAQNLRLRVDGADLRWTPVPTDEPAAAGNSRSVTYTQTLRAELAPGAHEIALSNGNYPDQTSFFYWKVEVEAPWRVQSTSLVDVEGDRVLRTRDGQWRMDEEQRELTLTLAERAGALARLEALLMPRSGGPVPLEDALDLGFSHDLRSGRLPMPALALGLVGAVLGGVALRGQPRRLGPALALAVGLGLLVGGRVALALALCAAPGGLVRRAPAAVGWVALALLGLFAVAAGLTRLG